METGRRLPPTSQAAEGRRISIGALAEEPSQPLADILRYRRSTRTLGPLSLTALATVLVRSGRVRSWDTAPDGYQITHRPAPSAGARHPCDMVVAANEVEGLSQGWWTFDPVACELAVAQGPHPPLGDAMTKAMEVGQLQGRPGAVIFLVAHFDRTLSRYPAGGPLVWRDAGVLLGLLHLCASALELGSCIVGTCGVVIEQRHPELVTDIGAIALGRDMTA